MQSSPRMKEPGEYQNFWMRPAFCGSCKSRNAPRTAPPSILRNEILITHGPMRAMRAQDVADVLPPPQVRGERRPGVGEENTVQYEKLSVSFSVSLSLSLFPSLSASLLFLLSSSLPLSLSLSPPLLRSFLISHLLPELPFVERFEVLLANSPVGHGQAVDEHPDHERGL